MGTKLGMTAVALAAAAARTARFQAGARNPRLVTGPEPHSLCGASPDATHAAVSSLSGPSSRRLFDRSRAHACVVVLACFWAVLTAPGTQLHAAPANTPEIARVALFTGFEHTPPDALTATLRQNLDTLLAPGSLGLDWHDLTAGAGTSSYPSLVVLRFYGQCDLSLAPAAQLTTGPLGWTDLSDGRILPFASVDCDRVRVFLGKDLTRLAAPERTRRFARALARVAAHEIYHVLAQTSHHAAEGVFQSAYTRANLLDDAFRFDEFDSRTLRAVASRIRASSTQTY